MDRNKDKNQRDDNSGEEDQNLPGYPHYPPEEDIMNPKHGFQKIPADEELANSRRLSSMMINEKLHRGEPIKPAEPSETNETKDNLGIVRGTDADVTKEDMTILGDKDIDLDLGDDELVLSKTRVDDMPGEQDLDVPGSDLDDPEENLGEEDEENNYYSLGGDRHEDLEEDPSQ
jgi:hypothetical protein